MARLYYTHEARMSKIEEIKKQIETLGHIPNGALSYLDYRAITQNLNMLKDAIEYEDRQEENKELDKAVSRTKNDRKVTIEKNRDELFYTAKTKG